MRTLALLLLITALAACAARPKHTTLPSFRDYTCRHDNLTLRLTNAKGWDLNRMVVYVVWQLHSGTSDLTEVQALAFIKHWDPEPGKNGYAYVSPEHPDTGMEVRVLNGFQDRAEFSVWYSFAAEKDPFTELRCAPAP